ncbi:MAG: urea ABC transporter permease subunit UrtB [Rhizobiaceae bacterium]|nr:urea ABC transporter permease subunit UrtB [Rhizobiaceae bacterium]
MSRLASILSALILLAYFVAPANASPEKFAEVLERDFKLIQRSSVKTVTPVLEAIQASGFENAQEFLSNWQEKSLWFRKEDNRFFYVTTEDKKTYTLIDVVTGEKIGEAGKRDIKQIKPNSGVRKLLGSALVQFRLVSPDLAVRRASLESISRDAKPEHLPALRNAVETETDLELKTGFIQLERLLTMQFGETPEERIEAINSFAGDLNLEVRANLNPLLASKLEVASQLPEDANIARIIIPGETGIGSDASAISPSVLSWFSEVRPELDLDEAYLMLVKSGAAPAIVTKQERDNTIVKNIKDGMVGRYEIASLNTEERRDAAYSDLVLTGVAEPSPSRSDIEAAVSEHVFFARFDEPDSNVTDAVRNTLGQINASVRWNTFLDLALDAISLASIYFLAAIGLAITFGVMRVINMAHGEFIMMGAYSGYVVQQFITNYTLSIIVAIPVAFAVTFAAGVALERLVIRHLYDRPLETLLATFGVSIALQQLAKNIFGTQARPLTAPDWLDGALVINDVVSISWIRIAIFGLSILFFVGLWWTLNKTRLGLETRAVVQNPRMAASMGINPDRINMLTFGLGSGIAGIAGVAIGLYAKVTSELGSDYIVQSFMTVVIGGVGNIWGTLAGAGLIGIFQKLIESFNPSNTLAAQTYMIIIIIIFIQFRPRGIIALKGRAAEA